MPRQTINRERVEAINQAEGILHDTESKMDEFKDQLPSEDVAKMKEKITEVRDKLQDKENMDPEEIKKTVSDLQQSSLKLFEMAYKKMAADKDQGSSGSADSSSGEKIRLSINSLPSFSTISSLFIHTVKKPSSSPGSTYSRCLLYYNLQRAFRAVIYLYAAGL